jgi:hypothetical protein
MSKVKAFADQHFEAIRAECMQEEYHFVDPEFPPNNDSISPE